MDVHGAVCVVTGAAGGIGAALAEALLERGAKVALTDLDGERLSATRERLATAHGDVVAAAGDASSAADIAEVIVLAEREFGAPVDVYVANAGVGVGADLADEASWTIEGRSIASKTYPTKEDFLAEVIRPFNARMAVGIKPAVRSITAEAAYAAIAPSSSPPTAR